MSPELHCSQEQLEALIGLPAHKVVKAIFSINPALKTGYLIPYDYQAGHPHVEPPLIPFNSNQNLETLIRANLEPGYDVGLFSRVETLDGLISHLPLIDFELEVSHANLALVKSRLSRFPIGGRRSSWVILDSGFSYHAYCLDQVLPIGESEEMAILGYAEKCHELLDFDNQRNRNEIIHSWWFVHCAAKRGMVLRLSRNRRELKTRIPQVVGYTISVSG